REHESRLRNEVEKRLSAGIKRTDPIVLHGQTGTGKTVALEALAYHVAAKQQTPVVYVEHRTQLLPHAHLDAFFRWSEEQGAVTSLLVWDGMVTATDYYDALRYFESRGRRVVLVGSTYRIPEGGPSRDNYIEAPARLSEAEHQSFLNHLASIDHSL